MGSSKPGSASSSSGELLEAVSNLVVRVYADHVGRGPTKARAYADRDIIVCVMEDTMTKAERTLIESGQTWIVKQSRDALQETMREDLARGIEDLTGRRVIAQTGTGTLDPDVSSDLFILDGQTPSPPGNGNGRRSADRGSGNGRPAAGGTNGDHSPRSVV
jgi:uncharacterized protein YbcI